MTKGRNRSVPKSNKQRGYLYARFSSDNQREVSIDDQFKQGEAYCAANGIEVVGRYSDHALTGRNDKRPDFQRMMREINGCDIVVIWNTDRLHRNMINAFKYLGQLLDAGVDFASITQPELNGDSEVRLLLFSVYAWKDQRYSEDLSANVERGMRSKAERCEYLGYRKFGYSHQGDTITIDEEQAEWVRRAHEMWQNGETIAAIADAMNCAGVRSCNGAEPGYNFIRGILMDESYTGVYIWADVRKEGGMPEIISKACYERTMRRFSFRPRKKESRDYLLSGRLVCGVCLNYMHGEAAKGGKVSYYCCKGKRKACIGNIRADKLEAKVIEATRSIFCDYDNCKRVVDFILEMQTKESPRTDIAGYEKELKAVARKRRNVVKAIEDGLPMADARQSLEGLERQADAIRARLEEAKRTSAALKPDELFEMLDAVRSGKFSNEEVLETFVSDVYIYEDKLVIVTNLDDGKTEPMEVYTAIEKEEPAPQKGTGNIGMVGHTKANPYQASASFPCRIIYLTTGIASVVKLEKQAI